MPPTSRAIVAITGMLLAMAILILAIAQPWSVDPAAEAGRVEARDPAPPEDDASQSRPISPSASAAQGVIEVGPDSDLQAAIDGAPPGSVLRLHEGTYRPIELRAALTIEAAGDGEVVISGAIDAWDAGILVRNAPDVQIRGITVRGNTLGVYLLNSPGVIIEDNVVTDNAFGLEIHGETRGTIVRRNRIVDNDRFLDPSRSAGGINLFETSGSITITENSILHNDSVGIEIYGMDDAVIDSNTIAGSADAIETGTADGGDCRNNEITRNLIYQTSTRSEERGIWLRCLSESLVANNTIYGMDRFGIGVSEKGDHSGPIDDLRIVNNLIVGSPALWLSGGLPDSVVIDHNGISPCGGETCNNPQPELVTVGDARFRDLESLQSSTPYMGAGTQADPAFVDPSSGDFRLQSESPAIDRGTPIGLAYEGTAPDLGHVESE